MSHIKVDILNWNGKIWNDIRETNFFDNIQNIFPLQHIYGMVDPVSHNC